MNLARSSWLIAGIYVFTLVICIIVALFIGPIHPILKALVLDVIGTVLIFLFSMIFNNSSMYDPYWSVAPLPILIYWVLIGADEANVYRQFIILMLVFIWGIRLTYNWITRWTGLKDEDWRYVNFRNRFKRWYWPVSFLGIHFFPTMIVFFALVSVYPAMQSDASLGILDFLATGITVFAIYMEWRADRELRNFLHRNDGSPFLRTGLWKYSRHPNYFGEVLFWIGLFLFSMSSGFFYWWIIPGPVLMILLFYFISIPMIDKRMMSRKAGYREYMSETSSMIPWPF